MTGRFEGIFAALTTPFAGEDISPDRIAGNVERYNATGLAGFLVLGSTGESVSLSDDESAELVRAVVKAAGPGKRILAGTARESTRLTVDFTNRAADLGIEAALVRVPSYFKSRMTRDALLAHYSAVADRSRVPIILYNIPQTTGISLESSLVVELSRHPNIVGLKESGGNLAFLGEVIRAVPPGFSYLLGSGSVFLPALELGACGAILAVADAAPEICVRIFESFRQGKLDDARRLQLDIIPLNKAVTESIGIAGLKHALDLRRFHGGPARLPLLPPDAKARDEISGLMKALGLI
jgi:4-hydroxy-2-oxoglutarate aldolase